MNAFLHILKLQDVSMILQHHEFKGKPMQEKFIMGWQRITEDLIVSIRTAAWLPSI